MISPLLTLLGLLLIIFAIHVDSVCFQGQVRTQLTKYGTTDTQCAFNNIRVLPGSSLKLPSPDCLDCKCTAKSMSCCGFGFTTGVVAPPPGCVAYNDACKLIFVKANNSSVLCKSDKSPPSNKKKPAKTT